MNAAEPIAIPVKEIALHKHPDDDCLVGRWGVHKRPDVFPGGQNRAAKILFFPQGPPPGGKDALWWQKKGTLFLDCGEGPFDHHPHGKCVEECCSSLVFNYTGDIHERAIRELIGYVKMHDLEGPVSLSRRLRDTHGLQEDIDRAGYLEAFAFSRMLSIQRKLLGSDIALVEWSCDFLDEWYKDQVFFWTVVLQEFQEKAVKFYIENGERQYKIAVIQSNLGRRVGSISRTSEGGFFTCCIHQEPATGHVFISGRLSSAEFRQIGQVLRVWELKKRDIRTKFSFEDLCQSKFGPIDTWYLPLNYRKEIYITMSGGEKATDIQPTVLTTDEIASAVHLVLDTRIFHPSCPHTHCLLNTCPYYPFFLDRCRKIRNSQSLAS